MIRASHLSLVFAGSIACSGSLAPSEGNLAQGLSDGPDVQLLPRRIDCQGQITEVPLSKYAVTAADLADPSGLVVSVEPGNNNDSPWRVELFEESLEIVDESFLCDGIASITFPMKDVLAPAGTTAKDVVGESYYEMRGEETTTVVTCRFSY